MDWFSNPEIWIGLLTLTALEIVLGIDNIVFISILAARLPRPSQNRARLVGLSLALLMRVGLLLSLSWIIGLTRPLFTVGQVAVTGRALILLFGGLFLLAKSTREIHHKLDEDEETRGVSRVVSFTGVILQIALLDAVFSLDSVITAVGMVDQIGVMIAAVVIAIGVMMIFSGSVTRFIDRHPTLKMLALSFLILIGANLIAEGIGIHIPKGYTYFAMGFSLAVEFLNIRLRRRRIRKRKRRTSV
ncbi:MAG: TerC family protein [Verrucomicrobiota bacterium]|nr:TerC family protein [Verrucomicrobiota bacterium]